MISIDKAVTLAVLAGGEGRRMGGVDKGLLPYQGKTLVEHVLNALPQRPVRCVISANRNLERYRRYAPVVEDQGTDRKGPLAGILAAMQYADTPYLLVLPCDTPQLPTDLLPALSTALESAEADIAFASSGEHQHFVIALMKTALKEDLADYLAQGGRRVREWQQRHRVVAVEFAEAPGLFANINRAEALQSR